MGGKLRGSVGVGVGEGNKGSRDGKYNLQVENCSTICQVQIVLQSSNIVKLHCGHT